MTPLFWKKVALSFVRAFVPAAALFLPQLVNAGDLSTAQAIGYSAIVAGVAAGLRAVQALFTTLETPAPTP